MWSELILAYLKAAGKTPFLNETLIICYNGKITTENISLTVLELEPSVPAELPRFGSQTIFVISKLEIGLRKT